MGIWFYNFSVRFWDDLDLCEKIETGITCGESFEIATKHLADNYDDRNILELKLSIIEDSEGAIIVENSITATNEDNLLKTN